MAIFVYRYHVYQYKNRNAHKVQTIYLNCFSNYTAKNGTPPGYATVCRKDTSFWHSRWLQRTKFSATKMLLETLAILNYRSFPLSWMPYGSFYHVLEKWKFGGMNNCLQHYWVSVHFEKLKDQSQIEWVHNLHCSRTFCLFHLK